MAGTIGARDVGEYGVAGIAPDADIYAYRVLGPYGSGYSSWVLGGIDRSVQDGMDVINLSLGNSRNDPDYVTSVALNNLRWLVSRQSLLAAIRGLTAGRLDRRGRRLFRLR